MGQARVDKLSELTTDDEKVPPDMDTQQIVAITGPSARKNVY